MRENILAHEQPIVEYEQALARLKESGPTEHLNEEIEAIERKLNELKTKVYGKLGAWERVQISRHPGRPRSIDFIKNSFEDFFELFGDRLFRDDPAIVAGLAKIEGMNCMVIAQEKGNDTESRMKRNFGMVHPEGFRKAKRLMEMAEKFALPVVCLIDTPGAYPGLEAEQRGQGWAIAENLKKMAVLKTPIIVTIIGEGCSGGALGIGIGDHVAILEHAYYTVISPEGCASILWKDASKCVDAAATMRLNSEELLKEQVVDAVLAEPLGGAHHDCQKMYADFKEHLSSTLKTFCGCNIDDLVKQRYLRFRRHGRFEIKLTSHKHDRD